MRRSLFPSVLVLLLGPWLSSCGGPGAEIAMEAERLRVELEVRNEEAKRQEELVTSLRAQVGELLDENQRLTQRVESAAVISGNDQGLRVAMLEQELMAAMERAALCEPEVGSGLAGGRESGSEFEQVITTEAQIPPEEVDAFLDKVEQQKRERIERAQSEFLREQGKNAGDEELGCCVYLFDPQLGHVSNDLWVTGTFENGRDVDISGDLIIEIFDGTELCYSVSSKFTVPSQLQQDYEFTFRVPSAAKSGRFQARVRWEDSLY